MLPFQLTKDPEIEHLLERGRLLQQFDPDRKVVTLPVRQPHTCITAPPRLLRDISIRPRGSPTNRAQRWSMWIRRTLDFTPEIHAIKD
jgi:hypothetical protein